MGTALLTEDTAASGFTPNSALLQILIHSSPPCQRGGTGNYTELLNSHSGAGYTEEMPEKGVNDNK